MRLFARTYNLVYIQFRGEEGQNMYDSETFQGRFKSIIDDGNMGYHVQGLELHMVVCSASQMREQTAVFIIGNLNDVEDIRNQLLNEWEEEGDGEGFCCAERVIVIS